MSVVDLPTHALVIGLTGGIGSGKSLAADHFVKLGAGLVDTDVLAHRLSQPGQAGAEVVGQYFGSDYLLADGAINRARLRQRVFQDATARQQLEYLLHPLILAHSLAEISRQSAAFCYLVLAVPLLFESDGYAELCDRTLVVDCPVELQIQRVVARSHLQPEEIRAIIASQMDRQARIQRADDVLSNDGPVEMLLQNVEKLHWKYVQLSESKKNVAKCL